MDVPAHPRVIAVMAATHGDSKNKQCLENTCGDAVGLLMTYRCNLKCKYCYIQTKQNKDMSLEMAQTILEPFLMTDGDFVEIVFMGGETLLAIDVIRPLVEWVEQGTWKRKFRFIGTTNGTLLTPELREWLQKHRKSLTLGLSFDGIPSAQRNNRGNDDIDTDFFVQTWPYQPLQMTINTETVHQMAEGVIYLLEKGALVHPNVAYEEREWPKEFIDEYGNQLNKLIYYYQTHQEKPLITQFQHNLKEYADNIKFHPIQKETCGAGHGFQIFDIDGTSYPCHILSPLVLRDEKLGAIQNGLVAQTADYSDSRCDTCPYVTSCPTCIASNYLYRNELQKRDDTHCKIMQLEVKAFIKKEVLRLQQQEQLSAKDAAIIDAIRRIRDYESSRM